MISWPMLGCGAKMRSPPSLSHEDAHGDLFVMATLIILARLHRNPTAAATAMSAHLAIDIDRAAGS